MAKRPSVHRVEYCFRNNQTGVIADPFPLLSSIQFEALNSLMFPDPSALTSRHAQINIRKDYSSSIGFLKRFITGVDESLDYFSPNSNQTIELENAPTKEPFRYTSRNLGEPVRMSIFGENYDFVEEDIRWVKTESNREMVRFTDGHRDYNRILGIMLEYTYEDMPDMNLLYSIRKRQAERDQTSVLEVTATTSDLGASTYLGTKLNSHDMSAIQEVNFMNLVTKLGNFGTTDYYIGLN